MSSYMITGAAKGLGLELTTQLLARPASQVSRVFGVTRSDPTAPLKSLIDQNQDRLFHVKASVDRTDDVEQAAKTVKEHLGGSGLDVLINNAGIHEHLDFQNTNGKIENFTDDTLARLFNTNIIGPHRVTKAFLPLLHAGKGKRIINISSTMGSIGWADDFKVAPGQAYKTSKAGLNMLTKQYALDYADEGFIVLSVSPGHLQTELGGDYAPFSVDIGAKEVLRIITEATPAQNGTYLNIRVPGHEGKPSTGRYDGGEIPW